MNFLTFVLFFSLLGHASGSLKSLPNDNNPHMNYILKDYIPWLENYLHFDLKLKNPSENIFLQENIKKITNWTTPEEKFFPQIMIGIHHNKDQQRISFQVYIQKEMRNSPFIKNLQLSQSPLFISWSKEKKLCFVSMIKKEEIPKGFMNTLAKGKYFRHDCKNKNKYELYGISVLTNEKVSFPSDIFNDETSMQLQFFSKNGLEEIISLKNQTNALFFPVKIRNILITHLKKTLLPFSKYGIDKHSNLSIYLP
jgi:hypothetical protein